MNIDDFDELQKTAKSTGTATQADVNEYLSKQALNSVSDEMIGQLSGSSLDVPTEPPLVDAYQDNNQAVDPLSQRPRNLHKDHEPFFSQQDTFNEANFRGDDDQEESQSSDFEAGFGEGLGDAEDTIVD